MNQRLNEYYLRILRDEREREVERLQRYRLAERAKRQEARAKAPRHSIWSWLRFPRREGEPTEGERRRARVEKENSWRQESKRKTSTSR